MDAPAEGLAARLLGWKERRNGLVATFGMSEQLPGSQFNAKSNSGLSFLSSGDRQHLAHHALGMSAKNDRSS